MKLSQLQESKTLTLKVERNYMGVSEYEGDGVSKDIRSAQQLREELAAFVNSKALKKRVGEASNTSEGEMAPRTLANLNKAINDVENLLDDLVEQLGL